ncbi:MAG: histidinol dehydrogenase [Anaerovorax sp.]|nr:histidinol dehydrogenase [Anaerovorax sp.]
MIQIYERDKISLEDVLDRERKQNEDVSELVDEIILQVCTKKDAALFEYEKRFDKVELKSLAVTEQEIQTALNNIDPIFLNTLMMASENIKNFHRRQIRTDFIINDKEGVIMGQKITPIAKAGIYVPGGTASYPSSVLMNAIPAKLAGVEEIIMVTPPDKEGRIADSILAAASIAGVTKIFKIGGAQAIAALAYGTESIPKVDKIVGPGNIFVATAKSKVFGLVDIDMIAGPSEILVLADETCNPSFVAADLLSQAEHDELATAILVTNSMDLAEKVQDEIERQVSLLPREEIARASIDSKGKILLTASLEEAIEIANNIAPEHLEICMDDPFSMLPKVKNAGSIFLGKYAPEALGDYFAGPNHVLPTSGTARFSSPLSVDDFIKKSSYLYYTKEALESVKNQISDFANREGLSAHAKSIAIRFEEV